MENQHKLTIRSFTSDRAPIAKITFGGKEYLARFIPGDDHKVSKIIGEIIRGGKVINMIPHNELANTEKGEIGINLAVMALGGKVYYVCKEIPPQLEEEVMKGYNSQKDFSPAKR